MSKGSNTSVFKLIGSSKILIFSSKLSFLLSNKSCNFLSSFLCSLISSNASIVFGASTFVSTLFVSITLSTFEKLIPLLSLVSSFSLISNFNLSSKLSSCFFSGSSCPVSGPSATRSSFSFLLRLPILYRQ